MKWLLLGAIAFVAIGIFLPLRIFLRTRRIVSPTHLVEIAKALSLARAAAIEKKGETTEAIQLPGDPRVFVTRGPLAVVYSISAKAPAFVHHWSVSVLSAYTPVAIAGPMAVYVSLLLGLDPQGADLSISQHNVGHGEISLDETHQSEFESREMTIPSQQDAKRLHEDAFAYFMEHPPDRRDLPYEPAA
jgi:hypothetical protein